MGAVNDAHPFGNVVNIINEDRTFFSQLVDHKTVVHNLLTNIDGGAKSIERYIHHVDGADHAGTKPTRLEKEDPFARG
jgi:hypothetical protein